MAESYTGEAYCVKCKEKREFTGHVEETNGRRFAKGICPACGTTVTRILGKAEPPALTRPTAHDDAGTRTGPRLVSFRHTPHGPADASC